MNKAILCIGNTLRGDDGVGIYVGELVKEQLLDWKVFFGGDTPENECGYIREFAPDILVVVDAMSGFSEGHIEFIDLSDEVNYMYSTHNLPTPLLLGYLRQICPNTLFLGISVLLDNVLDFNEGLSDSAKNSAQMALEKIKSLDEIIKDDEGDNKSSSK